MWVRLCVWVCECCICALFSFCKYLSFVLPGIQCEDFILFRLSSQQQEKHAEKKCVCIENSKMPSNQARTKKRRYQPLAFAVAFLQWIKSYQQ